MIDGKIEQEDYDEKKLSFSENFIRLRKKRLI